MELLNESLGKDMYNLKLLEYKPMKLLGEGTFSKVYLVEKFETKELRSIKIIEIANRPERDISTLSNEINNLKYLDHPNIIRLDDHFRTQNRLYLIFYYVNGITLSEYIKTIKTDQYFDIVKQLSYTVHYMHKNNIIHRDIKPQNILITSSQYGVQPILLDFGLSTRISRDQRYVKGQSGTPFYMAPEIHQNYAQDFKVDIWALGICFYNMVNNGFHPFCNDEDILPCVKVKMILGEFKREWPKIDKNLKDLIQQCLQICSSNRISGEQLLCHPYLLVQEIGNQPRSQARRTINVRFSVDNLQRKEQEKSVEKPQHRQQTPQQASKIKTEEDSPVTRRLTNRNIVGEKSIPQQQNSTPKQFRIAASPIKTKTEQSQSPNRNNSFLNHRKISIPGHPNQSPLGQKIQSPFRVQGNIFSPARRNSPSISIQKLNSPQLQNQSPIMPKINKLPPKAPIKLQVIK